MFQNPVRCFALYCAVVCFRNQGVIICIVLRCVLFQNPVCDVLFCIALGFVSEADVVVFYFYFLYCIALCFVPEAKTKSFVLYFTVFCFRNQNDIFCIALHCVLFQKSRCDTLHCIALCYVSEVKV